MHKTKKKNTFDIKSAKEGPFVFQTIYTYYYSKLHIILSE